MKLVGSYGQLSLHRVEIQDRSIYEQSVEQIGNQWALSLFDRWVSEAGGLYVAYLDKEIIASSHLRFTRPNEAWNEASYIGPAWRGQGFANDFMHLLLDEAKRLGAARIGGWTVLESSARVHLKQGYVECGTWLKGGKLPPLVTPYGRAVSELQAQEAASTLEFIRSHPVTAVTRGWIPCYFDHLAFHTVGLDDVVAAQEQGLLLGTRDHNGITGLALGSRVPHWESGLPQLVVLQVYAETAEDYLALVTALLSRNDLERSPNLFSFHPGDQTVQQLSKPLWSDTVTPVWSPVRLFGKELV